MGCESYEALDYAFFFQFSITFSFLSSSNHFTLHSIINLLNTRQVWRKLIFLSHGFTYKIWWEKKETLKSSIIWDITPCSPLKFYWRSGGIFRLLHYDWSTVQARNKCNSIVTCFTLVLCLAYSLNQKMEATCSSETSLDFQRTTWRYIPEERTLRNHRCENLKSYKRKRCILPHSLPRPSRCHPLSLLSISDFIFEVRIVRICQLCVFLSVAGARVSTPSAWAELFMQRNFTFGSNVWNISYFIWVCYFPVIQTLWI
jgi:hypothetical protein